MLPQIFGVVLCLIAFSCTGCGTRSVQGGTKGVLRIEGVGMSEIQITIHRVNGSATEPIGFGTTRSDGAFDLLTPGAKGALWLVPGDYRVTLESIGPPIEISHDYLKAETTPLKVSWSTDKKTLELDVPRRPTR